MRLINVESLRLEEFMVGGSQAPPYAILSHTWADDEVTFQDFTNSDDKIRAGKKGFDKIARTCALAKDQGLGYAWVDTCCIDKTSSAELTEAINSMFQWYQDAVICYAWLADLPTASVPGALPDMEHLTKCRWFTRGWTLQELLAPRAVIFYDQTWTRCGSKSTLCGMLADITNINAAVLEDPELLPTLSIAQRMSWAAARQTTRIEDAAYCLLGIFDVNMPMLYGEGSRAFLRLQEEIARENNDLSIFAWRSESPDVEHAGMFATCPVDFLRSSSVRLPGDAVFNPEFVLTNKGLRINTSVYPAEDNTYLINLNCNYENDNRHRQPVGIFIKLHGGGVYSRAKPSRFGTQPPDKVCKPQQVFLFKQMTAARLRKLAASHSNAFMLRRGSNFTSNINDLSFPFAASMVMPQEQWDSQRRMFLTHGAAEFSAYLYFHPLETHSAIARTKVKLGSMSAFLLAFGKDPRRGEPWVSIVTMADFLEPFSSLPDLATTIAAVRKCGPQRMANMRDEMNVRLSSKVSVHLGRATVDGQKVFSIDLTFTEALPEPTGIHKMPRRLSG